MQPIHIFATLGLTMFMMGGDDAPDDTQDEPTPEPEDQATIVPIDDLYDDSTPTSEEAVENDGSIGTEGDDIFVAGEMDTSSAYGGDGNDTFLSNAPGYGFSTIEGGAGDDFVDSRDSYGAEIYGGDGDDHITVGGTTPENITRVFGGSGDDLIDATMGYNQQVYGDDGADTILTSDGGSVRHGIYFNVSGGAGDDLFIHETSADESPSDVVSLRGEEGVDRFEMSINENFGRFDANWDAEYLVDENGDWVLDTEGYEIESGNYVSKTTAVILSDFEPGIETIQVNVETFDPSYSATSAELIEKENSTELVIRYYSDTAWSREMEIEIDATGVTWDDITFVGDNIPAVLVPV